jgi:threonine dehydrogenase-like Zn-dependent dehydrogenase
MRAAFFYGAGDIRVEDAEIPEIGDDDVLIKVAYCGICGSDLTAYRTGNYVPGIIIGHEFSGIVEKTGSKVNDLRKGDRVVGSSLIPCGHCEFCLSGKPNLCKNSLMTGITINGAFAEYVSLPSRAVFRIPPDLNLVDATLAEPLSIVIHGLYISSFRPGNIVLVQGTGPLGLLTLALLRISGAYRIFISDLSDERLSIASRIYPDSVLINPSRDNIFSRIDKETGGEGVDIIFDTTGSPSALKGDFTLLRRGGEIIVLGIPEEPVEADIFTTVMNELTIKGSFEGYNEFGMAIKLLSSRGENFRGIITSVIPLEDIVESGFKRLLDRPSEGKVVVKIGGDIDEVRK